MYLFPSQAPGRIFSCQLAPVRLPPSIREVLAVEPTKRKGQPLQSSPPSGLLCPYAKLEEPREEWHFLGQEAVLSSLSSRAMGLFSAYIHITKRPPFETFFQEQNDFLENDSLSSPLEIQAVGNSIAASLAEIKIIKFCNLICMQSVRHCYQ